MLHLFSFLLFLSGVTNAQEILWSAPGVGKRPSLSVQGSTLADQMMILSSPFGNQVRAIKLSDGTSVWTKTLMERISYPTLTLTDALVIQGDQGTIWAVRSEDGEDLWVRRTPEPLDYPMAPPRFRDQAVFTISRRGVIRKLTNTGEEVSSTVRPLDWGGKRAETVPLRSNQQQLSYLDQSGRLTVYDVGLLELISTVRLKPEGSLSNVLAGALVEDGGMAWVTELAGVLRAVRPANSESLWSTALGPVEDFWSEQGELLAVPSLLPWNDRFAVLLATRVGADIYQGESGRRLTSFDFPSPAVTAPVFDSANQRWWILCRDDLVSYDRALGWRSFGLPLVDEPFTLTLGDALMVIGSLEGRVYGVSVP